MITDIGGLGDKGFNDLCAKGVNTAKKKLGIAARVFISKSSARLHPEPFDGREAATTPSSCAGS